MKRAEGPQARLGARSGRSFAARLARTKARMRFRKANYAAARSFFSFLSAICRFNRDR